MSENVNTGSGVPDEQDLLVKHADLIAQLRDKYEEIAVWAAPAKFGGIIVATVPENPKATQKFINDANDPRIDKAVSMESYALQSIVHPDKDTAKQIFNRKPFLSARISARVCEMAGADAKELGKD